MAGKKMTARVQELRGMNETELDATILTAQRAIYQVRRDRLSKPIENVKATKAARKEIARVLTLKRERELAAEKK